MQLISLLTIKIDIFVFNHKLGMFFKLLNTIHPSVLIIEHILVELESFY